MKAFADAAADAVDALGPARLHTLADGLERGEPDVALCGALPVAGYADAVRAVRAGQRLAGVPDHLAAAYLRGVADGWQRCAASQRVESVWSGPGSHAVPVRSTVRVLVELIDEAVGELLLTTYSARPHRPVLDALAAARTRGARVAVVVETLQGAGGALSGAEPAAAFRSVPGVELWHWPVDKRPDRSARMHAKIAVADRRALLVSSANLTQSGADMNIEAGLLVRGGAAPQRAAEHLDRLVAHGTLARLFVGAR